MSRRSSTPTKRRRGQSVLTVIAMMFLLSAIFRAGDGTQQAIAQGLADLAEGVSPDQSCEVPDDMTAVIKALSAREADVDNREAKLNQRMQILGNAEREIKSRLENLVQAEENLRATIALADTAAETDIARLVSVYEAMKPKDAAVLFEEMSPQFAAGFLGRMKPEAAAGVLAGLSPEAAYSLSVILAGRNAKAGQTDE